MDLVLGRSRAVRYRVWLLTHRMVRPRLPSPAALLVKP